MAEERDIEKERLGKITSDVKNFLDYVEKFGTQEKQKVSGEDKERIEKLDTLILEARKQKQLTGLL
jgi:hypothetical protein